MTLAALLRLPCVVSTDSAALKTKAPGIAASDRSSVRYKKNPTKNSRRNIMVNSTRRR
jgi:hypothetical protein